MHNATLCLFRFGMPLLLTMVAINHVNGHAKHTEGNGIGVCMHDAADARGECSHSALYNPHDLRIYPNPMPGGIGTVRFTDIPDHLSVYDLVGGLVYHNDQVSDDQVIDLGHVPRGIYLLTAQYGAYRITRKIILR